MIKRVSEDHFQTEYLNFVDKGPVARGRTTHKFAVNERKGNKLLGYVKWFAQWRQYCFFPLAGMVMDKKCLRDIAEFSEERTTAHKERRNEQDVSRKR